MNKYKFLAAFAALAFGMGFTACSNDDDVTGDYEMNIFLRLNQKSSDEAESKQIFETYRKSLGITDQEEMIVNVTGKDSLACVKTVKDLCAKAETALNGQQWSDLTEIVVCIDAEKNSTKLYSKTFGNAADNDTDPDYYSFGYGRGGHTATAMCVQTQKSDSRGWTGDYPYNCGLDLNCGANGRYIYAMFDTEGVTSFQDIQKLVQENNNNPELNKYIADVMVVVSDSYPSDLHEFTYEGATYKYAHGIYGDPVMWDLNMGAGGPYLLLFYSTDVLKFRRVIDIDESTIIFGPWIKNSNSFADFGMKDIVRGPWEYSELVKGVRYKNGELTFECDGIDFNKDAGGAYIKMRADYIALDRLKGLTFDEKGNAIK